MKEPGQVAIKQALRHMGYSFRQIAKLTGVGLRTACNHIAAKPGSNVTPWTKRTKEQQNRALELAQEALENFYEKLEPQGQTKKF